jgi:anti-sigma B factor antagonist
MRSIPLPKTGEDILVVEKVDSACVVTVLIRELDTNASEELASRLLSLIEETKAKRFVLNFENVRFMESSCFGALVTFLKELAKVDGKVALTNVTENVRFLFTVTKLDKVFPIFPDVWKALQTLNTGKSK